MSDEDLICFCMSVTRGEIKEAIRAGHNTVYKLKIAVGCTTGCGTCELRVKKIIEEETAGNAGGAGNTGTEKKSA